MSGGSIGCCCYYRDRQRNTLPHQHGISLRPESISAAVEGFPCRSDRSEREHSWDLRRVGDGRFWPHAGLGVWDRLTERPYLTWLRLMRKKGECGREQIRLKRDYRPHPE